MFLFDDDDASATEFETEVFPDTGSAPVDNWINENSVTWKNESAQNWTSS